jgi:outer membrane lipoprotein-sorting protein
VLDTRTSAIVALFLTGALLSGCRHRPTQPTTQQWTDQQSALHALAERARAVKSMQSEGSITITRPDTGDSVRLDGAIALQPPDNARLRAWKIGQAVFDLTINPQGAWVVLPEDRKDQMLPAEGLTFDDKGGAKRFTVSRKMKEGTLSCDVERATLTPRVYRFTDGEGKTRFTLLLNNYRDVKGIAWPTELVAKGDGVGQVKVELSGVELNEEIGPKAFVPPRRAEKLP